MQFIKCNLIKFILITLLIIYKKIHYSRAWTSDIGVSPPNTIH